MNNWIRIANSFPSHPKAIGLDPEALWLFICAICYANEHLTDGHIPKAAIGISAPQVRYDSAVKAAKRLVSAGLFEQTSDGWTIHDYAVWQRSRDVSANGPVRAHAGARAGAYAGAPSARDTSVRAPEEREGERERETPPTPPRGGRGRARDDYEERLGLYALEHFPEMRERDGKRAVEQAVKFGKARTLEEVKAFVAQHWSGDDA